MAPSVTRTWLVFVYHTCVTGDYGIHVKYNDEHVPNSPAFVHIAPESKDAALVTVHGLRDRGLDVRTLTVFARWHPCTNKNRKKYFIGNYKICNVTTTVSLHYLRKYKNTQNSTTVCDRFLPYIRSNQSCATFAESRLAFIVCSSC